MKERNRVNQQGNPSACPSVRCQRGVSSSFHQQNPLPRRASLVLVYFLSSIPPSFPLRPFPQLPSTSFAIHKIKPVLIPHNPPSLLVFLFFFYFYIWHFFLLFYFFSTFPLALRKTHSHPLGSNKATPHFKLLLFPPIHISTHW